MKRVFALILLLIVAITTVTPCCVNDNCTDEEISLASNSEDETGEGSCSPFFSCSTCPGFVWTPKPVQVEAPVSAAPKHVERLHVDHSQQVFSSFWQPPRF